MVRPAAVAKGAFVEEVAQLILLRIPNSHTLSQTR